MERNPNHFRFEPKGPKYVGFPEKVKDILKAHSHIEFEFKGKRFAVIPFDDFLLLLDKWKRTKRTRQNRNP